MSGVIMDPPLLSKHVIQTSVNTSTITNVNLYTDRAQITRSYKIKLSSGTTKVVIEGLPNVMDHASIRVEGRGNALIQGVSVSKTPLEGSREPSSELLEDIKRRLEIEVITMTRYKKATSTIDKYMDTIAVEHLDIAKLGEAMDVCEATGGKWEEKIRGVEAEIARLKPQAEREYERMQTGEWKARMKLRTNVEIGLFKPDEGEGDVEIVLIYAVSGARWEAGYDIRVDMENPYAPVKVVYKAAISQRTGEEWNDVPITLETAQPTFGLDIPSLKLWTIKTQDPAELSASASGRGRGGKGLGSGGVKRHRKILRDSDDEDYDMDVQETDVTSQGKVNATFRVPGLVSVPSDDEEHGVVIASLELEARVTWACVPKENNKVFLEANITNSSEYTFLSGMGSVYVDRSFISRSAIPAVSPKETFKVALGVDPSIKVTYHPREKILTESGFYNKSLRHTFTQRISIHNTKSIGIEGMRTTDQIPVSQNATGLSVTLLSPSLPIPVPDPVSAALALARGTDTAGNTSAILKANAPTAQVSDGVVAMWNGTDEVGRGKDLGALGRDGKIDWVCAVPAFGRVGLVLKWEVVAGVKDTILGL